MANHPTEQQEVMRQAIHQTQDLIDSIYAHAIGVTRLVGLEVPDVPRLCISSACRTVEILIEKHSRRLQHDPEYTPADQAVMRDMIILAAADLKACLAEATLAADKLAEFAGKFGQTDPGKVQ